MIGVMALNCRHSAVILLTFALLLAGLSSRARQSGKLSDSELLGRALDYFKDAKYSEALQIFTSLEQKHKLNPRFRAYMGLCHYYEWQYEKAIPYLEGSLGELEMLSPQERNVYYFALAESHFSLMQYASAAPWYEKMLLTAGQDEKGDALYKLGFCYIQGGKWQEARETLSSALSYYEAFRNVEAMRPRIIQIRKMIRGLESKSQAIAEEKQ